jgi:16S rRNA (cytosine967-C5)-methyltransferase
VQDEGSQVVALAVASAPLTGRDERWLDVCAGPGGKTAMLATMAEPAGAYVVGAELRWARARLTARATVGLAGCAGVVQADGRVGPWRPGTFDRVLLDAPCTGLGALRRRPESRWRRTPGDVSTLVALQKELLTSALDAVRSGGLVGYVTCSPHVAETDIVVDDVLAERTDVVEVDARAGLPAEVAATLPDGPRVRLWPHRHDTDGMFLALLQRR